MPHPAELYIRYLMVHGHIGAKGREHVNSTLDKYQVPNISEKQWDLMQQDFQVPQGLVLTNKKSKETRAFMVEHDLVELWDPGPSEKQALRLCETPLLIQKMQFMLMGGCDFAIVADKMTARFRCNPPITPEVVALYYRYFWNVCRLSYSDWEALLYNDRMRDHYLSSLHCGPEQAMFRAGFHPKVDGKQALRDIHRSIYFRAQATNRLPDTKDTAEILTKYSKEVVAVHSALFSEGALLEEVVQQFKAFVLTTKSPNIIPIDALTEHGSFSHSGKVRLEEEEEQDVSRETKGEENGISKLH